MNHDALRSADFAPLETHAELTLDELVALVDLPKRTIRYYIQLGLVDRPEGETRAARYGARHLEQLATIRKWTAAGVSLERIRELLSGAAPTVPPRPRGAGTVEVWSHVVLADGLELTMEPGRAALSPEQVRELVAGVTALYESIRNKGSES
jgi:DNA-binding transcriptional MerR regulator